MSLSLVLQILSDGRTNYQWSPYHSRLACWADFLMGYDFKIIYHQGKENIVVNTLSCSILNQELKDLDTTAKYDMVVAKRLI